MSEPFKHSAETLYSFFSQAGRGFYIPYYQRNYSWDEENARKLINDIVSATKRSIQDPQHTIFLGTIILHDEQNARVGTHFDIPNLLTKVSNVVDGQQRITSIAMLACVISEILSDISLKITRLANGNQDLIHLSNDLQNTKIAMVEIFTVEVRRICAQPQRKPIIIRTGDVTQNPITDQWTESGMTQNFYRSFTSHFISETINGVRVADIKTSERIASVVNIFYNFITSEIESANMILSQSLLHANTIHGGALERFLSYPKVEYDAFDDTQKFIFNGGLLLLALCSFQTVLDGMIDDESVKSIDYDYSGRSMYGKTCTGIVVDQYDNYFMSLFVIKLIDQGSSTQDIKNVVQFLGEPNSDSLGTNKIIYFKNLHLQKPE